MSLKYQLDSLAGLAPEIAALYSPIEAGGFQLSVEGAVDKKRIDEFRTNNIELNRRLDAYKDVDPKKYGELLDLEKRALEKKLIDAKDVDGLVELRVGEMRGSLQSKIDALTNENNVANRQLESLLIDSTVRDAASKSGVQSTAVEDVLLRAKTVFKIKDGVATPVDQTGNVIYGKDGSTPMSVIDWAAGLKKQAPHLFQPSAGGGAPGSGNSGGQGGANLSSLQKINEGLNQLG
jgi:hypothetical protein